MQWHAVRDVFVAALDVDDDERDAFVERETTGHPDLQREVQRLLRLHRAAGDFLESAAEAALADDSYLLASGELVAERFDVLRPIGRGGMGEVYEALDRVLGERVALKVMRSTSRDPAAMTDRFRQEVQLARRITHAGVCRVHDVVFHRGISGQPLLVITMELLSGETLGERLQQGPLPAADARAITTDIAAALDAAHAHGILHGDIKPENVFLAERSGGPPRVVLTDFGLARALGHDGRSPEPALMGTPAYMAPELFRGRRPSVASDVYAFAVLIYRLLAPKNDLPHTTLALAFWRREPPSAPAGIADLDPHYREVLTEALSPQPGDRHGSATALAQALFPPPIAAAPSRLRRLAAIVLLAVVAAAGLRLSLDWWRPGSRALLTVSHPASLLLTRVDNRTGESALDGVTEVLRSQLAQSTQVELLETESITRVLGEMGRDKDTAVTAPIAREAALRQGASLVLYSQVRLAGAAYVVQADLENVGARPSIVEQQWTRTFRADGREQLLHVLRQMSNWVRETVGESAGARAEQDRPPADITTGSWEALRLFARASESYEQGDLAKAAVLLQEAVRLDPEFVSGHMRLGDVLIALRRDREGYAAWARAVALGNTRQLTTREALRLRGQFLEDTGSLAEAEAAFRAYVLHYPSDFNANMFLAGALLESGRPAEAVEWLTRARELRPSSPAGHVHFCRALIELGRLDEAEQAVAGLEAVNQVDWANWMRALIEFTRGHLPAALARLERLQTSDDSVWVSRSHTLRASWLVEGGRNEEAEAELRAGVAFDAAKGLRDREALKWIHLADLRARAKDAAASVDAAERAIAASRDLRTLTLAGTQLARLGRLPAAERVLAALTEEQPDVPRVRIGRQRLSGEIELARRRPMMAIEHFEAAARAARFTEDRMYYVRALLAARREDEAAAIILDWARHPARFYAGPEPGSTGPWVSAVEMYQQLPSVRGNGRVVAEWVGRVRGLRDGNGFN